MDDQQITAARNYLVGAFGQLNIDRLPKRSRCTNADPRRSAATTPWLVADSANGGTTLATAPSLVPDVSERRWMMRRADILEPAKAAGYRVGVVTSASVTDATPASFLAHVSFRGCEGPTDTNPVRRLQALTYFGCLQ
jgi:alkaline phosphatase